jgi:arylsulfatase A-like enzyme
VCLHVVRRNGSRLTYTVVEYENWGVSENRKFHGARAIRSEEWKYFIRPNGREGLYNLKEDAGELNNLLTDEMDDADRSQCLKMQKALLEWMHETGDLSIPEFETFFKNESKSALV